VFRNSRVLRRALVAGIAGALAFGLGTTSAQAATDAPSSYKSVKTTTAQGTWVPGVLTSTRDVDTYRFTTTKSRYARILLGDLVADYRLRLLDAKGRTVATSDRAGKANEEIYRKLTAGTYYVSVDAPHGKASTAPYVVKFNSLAEGVYVLSHAVYGSGRSAEYDFEVLNNTRNTIDGVGWTIASPCAATPGSPVDCGPPNVYSQSRAIAPRDRATFWTDHVPAKGQVFTLLPGSPITFTSKLSIAVTSATHSSSGSVYKGRVTNGSNHVSCWITPVRNSYDDRGNLLLQYEGGLSPLKAGKSTTFTTPKIPVAPRGTVRNTWDVSELGPGC
jgi:hypothetical protein